LSNIRELIACIRAGSPFHLEIEDSIEAKKAKIKAPEVNPIAVASWTSIAMAGSCAQCVCWCSPAGH